VLVAQDLSVVDIVKKANPCVVLIECYNKAGRSYGYGTGFFIGPGKILTNAHVVKGAYSIEIYSRIGEFKQIKLIKIDEIKDMAMLEIENNQNPYLSFEEEQSPIPGQRVIMIGNPDEFVHLITEGLITRAARLDEENLGELVVTMINAPGSSGSPILNARGHVIGMLYGGEYEGLHERGVSFVSHGIHVNCIIPFIRSEGEPRQFPPAGSKVTSKVILRYIRVIYVWTARFLARIIHLIYVGLTRYLAFLIFVLIIFLLPRLGPFLLKVGLKALKVAAVGVLGLFPVIFAFLLVLIFDSLADKTMIVVSWVVLGQTVFYFLSKELWRKVIQRKAKQAKSI